MSEIGSLIIKLQAETAQFRDDMGKVQRDLDGLADKGESVGRSFDGSMRESTAGVRLLSHELGVPLPREISRLIATIPGIGAAMSALLPVLGAVFAVGMIYKYVEGLKKAQEAMSEGFGKSIEDTANKSDELKVSIEKSKIKIDELLGKPTKGDALALEIAKARVEADKLSDSLKKDADELIKLMDKSAHGAVMTAILGTSGSSQAEDVMKGYRDAIAKIPKDAKDYNEQAAKAAVDAWQRAQSEIQKNKDSKDLSKPHDAAHPFNATQDFTKSNEALQEVQDKLSGVYHYLDLVKQNDAFDKQAKDVGEMVSAEDAAFDAQIQHNKEMAEWHKKKAHDQAEIAAAVLKVRNEEEKEAEEKLSLDALVHAELQRAEEAQSEYQAQLYRDDLENFLVAEEGKRNDLTPV